MDVESLGWAEIAAAHLAVVVAVVHLSLGLLNWVRWASAGFLLPRDLRWPLFVVSGVALLAGVFLVLTGSERRVPLYVAGIALMGTYVGGYFGWHLSGHRPLLLLGPGTGHEGPLLAFLLDHLFAGVVEFLAVVTEVALAAVLLYLLVARER